MKRTVYLLFLVPALLFADDVYLQGGAKFSGRIVKQTPTMITMDIGDGEIGIAKSRVTKIVQGPSPLDEYDKRAAALKPDDVDGWRSLGQWASQQGLSKQSTDAYQKVLDVAPNDPESRSALGYVKVNGQWMTEAESYVARGYVKHDGEWMTPQEAQTAESAAAKEQASEDAQRRADQASAEKAMDKEAAQQKEDQTVQSRFPEQTPGYWGRWGYTYERWPSVRYGPVRSVYRPDSGAAFERRVR